MKKITYTEALDGLKDPWQWARSEIHRRKLGSRELGEKVGVARSTLRQLYNGTVPTPNYSLMLKIVTFLLETRQAPVSIVPEHNPASMPRLGPSL